MTHDEILEAAFRVWGRESYRKMSLTELAAELGVTKPALYRHYRDKDALLEAMRAAFFDRYASAMKTAFPGGLNDREGSETELLGLVEALTRFFGARPGDLAFAFARILRFPEAERSFAEEAEARGLRTSRPASGIAAARVHLSVGSCFFLVAFFHLKRRGVEATAPNERELDALVAEARRLVGHGLLDGRLAKNDAPAQASLGCEAFERLETLAQLAPEESAAPDGLLPAVAAVVAEVGAWRASMEMVARRSGLSKSGLYSHFKSREDMLFRLFSAEFERASALLASRAAKASGLPERLYILMATASEYLLARPDILVALDWMRMQRLQTPELLPESLLDLFAFLGEAEGELRLIGGSLGATVRWILFMTIHLLMGCPRGQDRGVVYTQGLRVLHRFILGGLAGVIS